jgi:phytoene desaturase
MTAAPTDGRRWAHVNPVVVIGAGLAGLSAACYLTGASTTSPLWSAKGGRAGLLHSDDFTFATGPTVLTMPDLIAAAVRAASRDPSISLHELMPCAAPDPAYRACFADGSTINMRYGREAMREEIAHACGSVDAAAFDSFVDWLRQLYLVEMPNFIDRNYDSTLGLLSSPRAIASWHDSAPSSGLARRCVGGSPTRGCIGHSVFRRCMPGCRPIRPSRSMR